MSILDGMISSEAELKSVMGQSAAIIDKVLADSDFSPGARNVLQLMSEGLSLADIFDISKEERDALFIQGCRMFQVGEMGKARDILLRLHQIEPTDERPIYVLAATYQNEGQYDIAGKLYVQFLALDATNPDGYLRLGECFLAAGETKNAAATFAAALALAKEGKGSPAALAQAEKMVELTATQT